MTRLIITASTREISHAVEARIGAGFSETGRERDYEADG